MSRSEGIPDMHTFDAADPVRILPMNDATRWTVRGAVARSRTVTRIVAVVVAILAGATVVHRDVPVATAITVIAMTPAVLVDVLVRRLPNRLVAGAALVGGAVGVVSFVFGQQIDALGVLVGAAAMSVPLLFVHLMSPTSMGLGDVKAAMVLGAALGLIDPVLPVVALAIGSFGATIHGLATRSRSIAFGPGLLGGTVGVMVLTALSITVGPDGPTEDVFAALASAVIT